jgi:hypothetical protein
MLLLLAMRNNAFIDVIRLDHILPCIKVEAEYGLPLLNALFLGFTRRIGL